MPMYSTPDVVCELTSAKTIRLFREKRSGPASVLYKWFFSEKPDRFRGNQFAHYIR